MSVRIITGDCRESMAAMDADSIDSAVTDPPYHLTSIVKRFGADNAAPAKVGKTGAYARASKGFMGQTWDGGDVAFQPETWAAVLRVLKPGAHLVAFSGTRTYHRMACAIEDAGFEIRDQLAWCYGSGFPKSLDVSKAIDKAAGAERQVVDRRDRRSRFDGCARQSSGGLSEGYGSVTVTGASAITAPATDDARHWQGWGTALKPAWEPICLARKPITRTVASNVLEHATGALNIDGCRIDMAGETISPRGSMDAGTDIHEGWERPWMQDKAKSEARLAAAIERAETMGRWPANIIHDGSDEVLAAFPEVSGVVGATREGGDKSIFSGGGHKQAEKQRIVGGTKDSGSAARFFASFPIGDDEWEFARNVHDARSAENPCGLCGTPIADGHAATLTLDSKSAESQAGLGSTGICSECIPILSRALNAGSLESIGIIPIIPSSSKSNGSATPATAPITSLASGERAADGSAPALATRFLYCAKATTAERGEGNNHPTVKPIDLMRWLCRLVTPVGGTVLDPFAGSGSTLVAADAEQFSAIGCELSPDYAAIAERRVRDAAGLFAEVRAA